MAVEYDCIHEDQIQAQSRKIERLEARSDFKEKKIDDLNKKMDKLNDKFDKVLEKFNDLKLESKSDDTQLELRLKAIETELELQKQTTKNNYTRLSIIMTVITIVLGALTFYFNFLK